MKLPHELSPTELPLPVEIDDEPLHAPRARKSRGGLFGRPQTDAKLQRQFRQRAVSRKIGCKNLFIHAATVCVRIPAHGGGEILLQEGCAHHRRTRGRSRALEIIQGDGIKFQERVAERER